MVFFFQAEDGIRDLTVTGVQTCALPIFTASAIRTAQRVDRFTYAIRNIVAEAKKVEAAGKTVRYLNIGDPNQFGFLTPRSEERRVGKECRSRGSPYN